MHAEICRVVNIGADNKTTDLDPVFLICITVATSLKLL